MPLGKKFHVPVIADNTASGNMTPGLAVRGAGPAASPSPGGEGWGVGELPNRKSQEGIALVITLILLSVTLVMAVAFLAISRRERGSVSTNTDTVMAKNAVQSAFAQAQAQIVSQIETTTNPYITSLIVSTNYINSFGFNPDSDNSLTNVNYDYYTNGTRPLSIQDYQRNIANLFYSPRPPVFYSNDFRFYLDLNRNGMYDTNGVVANMNNHGTTNGFATFSLQVGDPEWIGVLEHPDQPHGPNNPFVARYCFIAVPADTLDLNHIHNQVKNPALSVSSDGYMRNQGVGTWEINLAAFLADLNTNIWDPLASANDYLYNQASPTAFPNTGIAFSDAFDLVTNRYAGNYSLLGRVTDLFGPSGVNAFLFNGIDSYTEGGVQTNFSTNYSNPYLTFNYPSATPWAGGNNTNNYFTPDDLFNTNATANFGIHLQNAGVNQFDGVAGTAVSTYDRYTFYRLLSQIGTDSQPESGQININYSNVRVDYDIGGVPTSFTVIPGAETNYVAWNPTDFFLAAADKMLRAYTTEWYESSPSNYMQTYYGLTEPYFTNIDGVGITNIQYFGQTNQIPSFGITNIPVYINGQFVYSPAVNRILQLAANIYDATTNSANVSAAHNNYPSVFRPILWKTNEINYTLNTPVTNFYIRSFQYAQDITPAKPSFFYLPTELSESTVPLGLTGFTNNFYGVPWIIGAKKGFPSFSGLEFQNCFFIERLLQFNRKNSTQLPEGTTPSTILQSRGYTTNQMYFMGVTNIFGVEDWNSYASNYLNKVTVIAQDTFTFGLSNDATSFVTITNSYFNSQAPLVSPWLGKSFVLPLGTNTLMQSLAPLGHPASTNNTYMYVYGNGIASTNLGGFPYNAPCFIATSQNPANYMDQGTPPLPHLVLQTTNRLQAWILDIQDPNNTYILDYVQLGGMNTAMDVNQAISDPDNSGLWSTNMNWGSGGTTPFGINEQYLVSSWGGTIPAPPDADGGVWSAAPVPGAGIDTSPAAQQAFFSAFFSAQNQFNYNGVLLTNTLLSIQAPFTPVRQAIQRNVYLVNDPLVHYITSDLYDFPDGTNSMRQLDNPPLSKLGTQPDRYMPWGVLGNITKLTYNNIPADGNPFNLSYKDPLVRSSDNWDFPTNKFPTVGWLGRVHRGTPWQSVFLKSTNLMGLNEVIATGPTVNVGVPTWQLWTGDVFNQFDAYNSSPFQDRLLFDLFTSSLNENAQQGQLSINIGANDPNNSLAGLASWSALLSGVVTLSNSVQNLKFSQANSTQSQSPLFGGTAPGYTVMNVQPAGFMNPALPTSPLQTIVQNINNTRATLTNIDTLPHVFEHVGDILSVPALSDASPLLSITNDQVGPLNFPGSHMGQITNGISDEMYEWLPQQIMSLLTVSGTPQSPPRYVVYCYGQTLKPAPNGLVSSGQFFGLCTNYQVTAETASRVVIRVENTPTPANPTATPHVVVEQFNPLPPD